MVLQAAAAGLLQQGVFGQYYSSLATIPKLNRIGGCVLVAPTVSKNWSSHTSRSSLVATPIRCSSEEGVTGADSAPEVKQQKLVLKIGSPVVVTQAPPLLKTAEPMPMMRPNNGLINVGDAGRSFVGLGDIASVDEEPDFWDYEASQHKDVEDAEEEVAPRNGSSSETQNVRADYVVPKLKYTRDSKGLKPTYRVFSRDRQTVPKPRINPYSVLLKMIDPANDDEYLDSELHDTRSVAHDMNHCTALSQQVIDKTNLYSDKVRDTISGEKLRLDMGGSVLEGETYEFEQDDESFNGGEVLNRVTGLQGDDSRELSDDLFPSQQLDSPTTDCNEEVEFWLPLASRNTEDNPTDVECDLVTVRLSDIWSDSDDEEDDDFDDNRLDLVEEEKTESEDPLRRFLNSRSGNRDSTLEGRVYKYNKAAKKSVGIQMNKSVLNRSGSLNLSKGTTRASNMKERGRLVCRAESGSSENQTDSSAAREVLQTAYNLPKGRVLEDYLEPFVNRFNNIQANLVLEALCADDLSDQVLSFFRWMRLHDPSLWDSRSFSLLFTFLARMNMPDEALVYFEMLPEDEQFRSVQVYNSLITCLTNCNRQEEVPHVLEKMQRLGLEPDAVTFSILMKSAVERARSVQEVWALYQDMVHRGVCPNVSVFGTLIKAFCDAGYLKEALTISTEMEKLKIPLNVIIYNILIDAYGRAGQLEEAEGLMAEMQDRGVHPNVGTYNALISSYLEPKPHRQFTVAEDLIEEMETSGLQPDVVTFTMLLGAYGHEGMTERAAQVFSCMEAKGVKPNSYSYTTLINAYAVGRWPEKAARAFEMMRSEGISPTVETFTALMDAYRLAGDLEMVNDAWKAMKEEGCVATRVTYITVLDAFQKQGKFKEVRDLIEEFRNRGYQPDLIVYNMLLNAYMRGGRHQKVADILQEMKRSGFLPDSYTYCTLIYGFLRVRDHTKALKFHREMMDRRQLPDAKTYAKLRAILKFLEQRGDLNNLKSERGKSSKPVKKGTEKYKSYWKRSK